jgi:3-carboxy-cis,cis-muconate cycloisomerase
MFDALYASPEVLAATGPVAWVRAMLDVEAALARAGAATGRVPAEAAGAIVACCRVDLFDVGDIAARAVASATPVVPLVADLRAAVPAAARDHVHAGATSQDVVDTAMMLVARSALRHIDADLASAADRLAELADAHRHTVHIGRTLLRHAAPTTFGAVAAGWLVAVDAARSRLSTVDGRLAVQYGGPVGVAPGTPAMLAALAADLDLSEPVLPWHTDRGRVGELASALGGAAGALGTVALGVALLSQNEIGELAEGGEGGSSAMPHKRNPAAAVLVSACAHRAPGLVATLLAAAPQELQRAAGRWQAEWGTLTDLLRVVSGAAAHARRMVAGLRVDADRMRANLDAADERVRACGPGDADALVTRALAAHAAGDLGCAPSQEDPAMRAGEP